MKGYFSNHRFFGGMIPGWCWHILTAFMSPRPLCCHRAIPQTSPPVPRFIWPGCDGVTEVAGSCWSLRHEWGRHECLCYLWCLVLESRKVRSEVYLAETAGNETSATNNPYWHKLISSYLRLGAVLGGTLMEDETPLLWRVKGGHPISLWNWLVDNCLVSGNLLLLSFAFNLHLFFHRVENEIELWSPVTDVPKQATLLPKLPLGQNIHPWLGLWRKALNISCDCVLHLAQLHVLCRDV